MLVKKIPDKIGRYRVIRELGRGGMGVVYLAHDQFIDRQVAIKTILTDSSNNTRDREHNQQSFYNEVRAAGKLMHPHIVLVYDAMWENDICYLIMEYVEGSILKKYCSIEALQPLDNVIKYIFQSAKALNYAHQNGVIHRDIKPSNIMISVEGGVKIADFGIAQVEGSSDHSVSGSLTGSVYYSSPEQSRNEALTQQTDIFSLGVVMYELLTGTKPFEADNEYAILLKIANEDPEPIGKYRQDVPEALERILMRTLEKDLTKRYQTGLQLAAELGTSCDNLKFIDEEINSKEKLQTLRKIRFFKDFTSRELAEVINTTQWLKYEEAEIIITEGDIETCFYIIVAGEVTVNKQGKRLAVLKHGDCFGEMAYLSTAKRTATIKALGNTVVMKINTSIIEQMSMSTQLRFYKIFSKTLVQRLSRTSQLFSKKSF
jgi:serine/threonine protein kinase